MILMIFYRTIMSAQVLLIGFYNNLPFINSLKFDNLEKIAKKFELNSIIPQINLFEKEKNSDKNILIFREKFGYKLQKQLLAKNMEKVNELKILDKIDE